MIRHRYLARRALFDDGLRHRPDDEARVVTDRETGRSRGFAFVSMASPEAARAAIAALNGPQDAVEEMRNEYTRRRSLVLSALSGIHHVHVLPPEGGFFAMVDARETGVPSEQLRLRLLNDAGVAVIHGAAYGPGGEGTLRVSFASGGDTLARGLERLRAGLEAL